MRLTQKTVAALTLPDGKTETIVFDDALPGFGLRVRAGGARTWIYQFKIGGQHRRVTLGSATALSPARARETAAEMHAAVRLGRDPAGEKTEGRVRASETMNAVLPAYLGRQRGRLRPRSYVECERHLLKNCGPLLGLSLTKIDRRAVAARIADIANTSGNVSANRARAALSAFFSWAMREGLLDANNPVVGTNRQPEKTRSRVLSDDELRIVLGACGSDDFSIIVRLLMASGQRANEIGALRWDEVVGDQIVLPPSRTKNGRQHVVPLAPAVRAILDGRERNGEFVFGRRQGRPFGGWSQAKLALDRRIAAMGRKLEHWTIHDLRRTAATHMADLGVLPHVAEAVLNHVSGARRGISGVYNRSDYAVQKKIALEKWSEHLEALESGKRPAKVVKLHRG